MAVGLPAKVSYANGDVFSASDINDTNGTINLIGQTNNFYAAKNKIINGNFANWQRGTTFTPTSGTYTSDRWAMTSDGTGATRTITRQTFTTGTAPVSGYEGQYYLRYNQSVAGITGTGNYLYNRIESVRTFAGQTVTLSFWAKADAARVVTLTLGQLFGSGGSPSAQVDTSLGSVTLTTSWVRYTASVAVPSISGKTLGTDGSDALQVLLTYPTNATMTIDLWGVQLESGSTATAFQTASGTIQGELALCQRYYSKSYAQSATVPTNATTVGTQVSMAQAAVPTGSMFSLITLPTTMRTAPTMVIYSYNTSQTGRVSDGGGTDLAAGSGNAAYVSDRVVGVNNNSGANITPAGQHFLFHWSASAEL